MSRQGSVKRDSTGRWGFVVDVRPMGGEGRKQLRRRGFKTKAEANDALTTLLAEVQTDGAYREPSKQSVRDFVDEWLETISPTVREATHYSYTRNLALHVVPTLGDLPLRAVDAGVLNRLYADLLADGNKARDGGLSPRSVRYVHTIVHRAFKDAVRWGRLRVNPSDTADPPKAAAAAAPEVQAWEAPTLSGFLTRSRDDQDRYFPLWLFLATTGMRRGEALGLRWSDLDLDGATAAVRQTVVVVAHQVRMSTPKTAKGTRTVALDPATVTALRAHRKAQAEERMLIGAGWRDLDLVFPKVDGEPLHPERVSREFSRRVERWELPSLTLHGLRHTWATLALSAGVHPRIVQERLGHSTIAVTLGTYSHVTKGMQDDAASKVAGLFL